MAKPDEFITASQASALVGRPHGTINHWVRVGRLKPVTFVPEGKRRSFTVTVGVGKRSFLYRTADVVKVASQLDVTECPPNHTPISEVTVATGLNYGFIIKLGGRGKIRLVRVGVRGKCRLYVHNDDVSALMVGKRDREKAQVVATEEKSKPEPLLYGLLTRSDAIELERRRSRRKRTHDSR